MLVTFCYLTAMFGVAGYRGKVFNSTFMQQFKEEHQKDMPDSEPATGGWPDDGNGRYASKLSYVDWMNFNKRQRTHQNFVENLPVILTVLIIGGLLLPKTTMYIGFINVGARLLYTLLYIISGADARIIGALASNIPINGLAIATLVFAFIEVAK